MGKTSSEIEITASRRPNPQFRHLILTLLEGQLQEKDVIEQTREKCVKIIIIYRLQMLSRSSTIEFPNTFSPF